MMIVAGKNRKILPVVAGKSQIMTTGKYLGINHVPGL